MGAARARAQVEGRAPVDEREAAARLRILAEWERLADPLDQNLDPVHVTGSAIVVGPRGVLLHRHKRLGLWLQPGGHLDPGEMPWDAAVRETHEETGLALVADAGPDGIPPLAHVDVHDGGRGHTHLDFRYLLVAGPDDEPRPAPGESTDVHWFGWEEAIARADPGLRGALLALRPDPGSATRVG
jgi:8-oxo-dGTP pyrophosphatase MutT (NUDIX family)